MNCETCTTATGKARACADEQHSHKLCNVCAMRYYEGPGQPIRCPDVSWDGRPDPEVAPAEVPSDDDEKPPF